MDDKISKLKEIIEKSNNIVFFGGAGVSTESGIPDFRSEDGVFKAMQEYGKPPEVLISKTYLDNEPEIVYDYYKKYFIFKDVKPNKAHLSLAKLEQAGKLKAVVTQNIDGLHTLAGSKNVFELHGSVYKYYCKDCQKKFTMEYILDPANCEKGIPKCDECGGIVRPDVVFYEEPLDQNTITESVEYIENAETLIVGGTSLLVYPAAGFINYFKGKNLVLINKTKTSYDDKAELVINDKIGEVLSQVV